MVIFKNLIKVKARSNSFQVWDFFFNIYSSDTDPGSVPSSEASPVSQIKPPRDSMSTPKEEVSGQEPVGSKRLLCVLKWIQSSIYVIINSTQSTVCVGTYLSCCSYEMCIEGQFMAEGTWYSQAIHC